MEGAGKVVGVMAAVVLLRHGHHAGQANEEQEEELDEKSSPEHAEQEGRSLRGGRRRGGRQDDIRRVRTGESAASGAWRSALAAGGHRHQFNTGENSSFVLPTDLTKSNKQYLLEIVLSFKR